MTHRRRHISTVCATGWLLLSLAGCGDQERPSTEPSASPEGPWNVVLVLVDTLRADHLGAYGYERPTSPNLDRFAAEAVRFENAYAQAGCTFPSVNSILTSRYPQRFQGRERKDWSIPEGLTTLPEVLQGRGYATAAVSASLIVRATPSSRNPTGGYGAGFDLFDEACENAPASCLRQRARAWLEELDDGRPFFLYLHFMEPHNPYRPPDEHPRRFAGPARHRFLEDGDIFPLVSWLYRDGPPVTMTAEDWQDLTDRYDEEIAYFDDEWPRLLELFDLDRTVVVLASDHGEELFDHGEVSHCRDFVWETTIRTPLLIWAPGLDSGGPRAALAQNLDIAPTVLDLLDGSGSELSTLSTEDLGFEGRSLVPALITPTDDAGDLQAVQRFAFAAQGTSRAVVAPPWKLHLDLESGSLALYDLDADPGELNDVLGAHPDEAERLRTVLFRWIEAMEGEVGAAESLESASETEKRLKALGYF